MDERASKAFDFASDLAKQLITLSTSIVTVTMLFSDHFPHSPWAKTAWVCYLMATLCGIWSLMALTGTVATPDAEFDVDAIYKPHVRIPAFCQIGFFALATIFTLIFVLCAF
jgi:hypothetical protein